MNLATTSCIALMLVSAPLLADVVYDESVSGDLSNDAASPTVIGTITDEILLVDGSVQSGSAGDTRDYFTITVPTGATLEAMRLVTYVDGTTGNDANTGYAMIDEGTSSVVPSTSTSSSLLGGSRLSRFYFPDSTVNMLVGFATGSQGGTGFSLPLGPGDYTINVQQTGPQLNVYGIQLEFDGIEAPCPADLDGNGSVDGGDLGLFLGVWGTSPCALDLDGDGSCTGADLGILLGSWGGC